MPKPVAKPGSILRRVRKGTKSCWECRGRKVKCIFPSSGPGHVLACEGCILRGTTCVSQEQPQQPLAKVDRRVPLRNRMLRVEQLIGSLVRETSETGPLHLPLSSKCAVSSKKLQDALAEIDHLSLSSQLSAGGLIRNALDLPPSTELENISGSSIQTVPITHGPPSPKYQEMSKEMLAFFPSEEGIRLMVKLAGLVPPFFHQIPPKSFGQRLGFSEMDKQNLIAELVTMHTYMTHPLVIVRQMLLLAIAYRYIHPASHQSFTDFPEWPGEGVQRMGEAAIKLLEHNDSMIETPEGLECLLLASSLHADSGNLRLAWSTTRRAMRLAQLVSLNRQTRLSVRPLQPGNTWDPMLLWHRIVFFDRFFSLALGLPQGSTDNLMTEGALLSAEDSPLWDLQKHHCAIAGRILQRNQLEFSSMLQNLDETQAIDRELQQAAQSMPARWWLVPNLASIADDWELYQATMRLTEQVLHNILLTQLHLPLMLQATATTSPLGSHESSLLTCVNASRDLLHRYMALRNFSSVSYCCHSMDFFAVTASVMLLLGYLHDHRSRGVGKILWHQRASDRAIMEDILVNMAQTGTVNKASALSERGASVLGRLLNIEERVWESLGILPAGEDHAQLSVDQSMHLIIPCLGIVTVNAKGEIQITGNGGGTNATATLARPEDVTAQPANENHQPGMVNHLPGSWRLDVSGSANSSSDFAYPNKQSDGLLSDAHMAFLASVMDNNGEVQQVAPNDDSWWLL